MTTSTAASNRKVVSTAIIAEKAAVCTCNARNNENAFSNIEVTGLELVGKASPMPNSSIQKSLIPFLKTAISATENSSLLSLKT